MIVLLIGLIIIVLIILIVLNIHRDPLIWQKDLPDDKNIHDVFIPGTHDSGAYDCIMRPIACCQDLTIQEQLEAGVRMFDIRVDGITNKIVHGPITCFEGVSLTFDQCLNTMTDFLQKYPSEFILMYVTEQRSSGKLKVINESTDITVGEARGRIITIDKPWMSQDVFYVNPIKKWKIFTESREQINSLNIYGLPRLWSFYTNWKLIHWTPTMPQWISTDFITRGICERIVSWN